MDQEIKEKWIAALRSGKFKQCDGELHNLEGSFCCLGVLLESQGWEEQAYHGGKYSYYISQDGDVNDEENELSDDTRAEFGLTKFQETHLIKMNDTEKKSFTFISNWIEDHL